MKNYQFTICMVVIILQAMVLQLQIREIRALTVGDGPVSCATSEGLRKDVDLLSIGVDANGESVKMLAASLRSLALTVRGVASDVYPKH